MTTVWIAGSDEFERCVSLLESSPDIRTRFHRSRVPGVRRLVMAKTKHDVYHVHDEANGIAFIHRLAPALVIGTSTPAARS